MRFERPRGAGFYRRDTAAVARSLLGDYLVRRDARGLRAARIVETEAYGPSDPASHAFLGPTLRNRSMFAPPGTIYVYRIHQVHCLNLVTRPGEAVLLRAAEPVTRGLKPMNGPGRLCRALSITRDHDGTSAISGDLRVLAGPGRLVGVSVGTRVGIRQASGRLLRFGIPGNPHVSRRIP